jgi:predicted secreted hydrolase
METKKRSNRRDFLLGGLAVVCTSRLSCALAQDSCKRIAFPADHGAHEASLTEWWYITGWLKENGALSLGMQITFFRSRPKVQEDNPSAFAPKQLLFAHAALSDPNMQRLQHDQRAARAGLQLAHAAVNTTAVWIDDWRLELNSGRYRAQIQAREFAFDLEFVPRAEPLLEGQNGFSRKGPRPSEASCYYSLPHLEVSGMLSAAGRMRPVSGQAWLDHEWSNNYLAKAAAGWDWIGINLDDGGALMAFRIRAKRGGEYWASATHRSAQGEVRTFSTMSVQFEPLRRWRSPHSGAEYPIAMRVRVDDLTLELYPLMDDQELDTRASTGAIYWEGAVEARRAGRVVGRGYLELTGYAAPLEL